MKHATRTLALTLLAGAALVACRQGGGSSQPPSSALPLDNTASAAPLTDAPAASALPPAPAAPVASVSDPSQSYQYADQAWAMSDAFGDSPPDYAFDDGGVTPWVWTASDNSICLAEAIAGGERYYYYRPGADQPFYILDPDYGYAFEGGALAAVYDHSGHSLPLAGHADIAGRYLARAEGLRRTATSAPHRAVAASNWTAQRGDIAAQRTAFSTEAAANPAWNAYHTQHAAQEQAQWAPETAKRETWAATTDARLGDQADAEREREQVQATGRPPPPAAPEAATDRAPQPPAAPEADRAPPRPEAAPERPVAPEAAAPRPEPEPRAETAPRPEPAPRAEVAPARPPEPAREPEARAAERPAPAVERPRAPEPHAPPPNARRP